MTARSQASKQEAPPEETEEPREGAPELETPERPPVSAPRSDEPVLETPERPAVTAAASRHHAQVHPFGGVSDVPLVDDPDPLDQSSEVAELFRHVSTAPVNAHAPVWVARLPNSP